MGRRIGDNLINQQFSQVGVYQELDKANKRVEELTVEIDQLRASGNKQAEEKKVKELRSSLTEQTIIEIKIENLQPNPQQPRQTFSEENLLVLARSLEQDGQQQPILVFQIDATTFLIFDGERRYRAAQKINWQTLQGIILPLLHSTCVSNPVTFRRQAFLANYHRENLNPLDMAEMLVAEIATTEAIEPAEVPNLLNAAITRLSSESQLELLTTLVTASAQQQEKALSDLERLETIKEKEKAVLKVILSLQLNPTSVKTNIFPSLNLFDDLKIAIRQKGLGGHQARVLQQLSAKKLGKTASEALLIRQMVTQEVIEKNCPSRPQEIELQKN